MATLTFIELSEEEQVRINPLFCHPNPHPLSYPLSTPPYPPPLPHPTIPGRKEGRGVGVCVVFFFLSWSGSILFGWGEDSFPTLPFPPSSPHPPPSLLPDLQRTDVCCLSPPPLSLLNCSGICLFWTRMMRLRAKRCPTWRHLLRLASLERLWTSLLSREEICLGLRRRLTG